MAVERKDIQGATPAGSGYPSSTEPHARLCPAGGSPSRNEDPPEPLLDPVLVEEAKAMIALDCSCDRDCEVNQEGICPCRITATAVMLKGAQSYIAQTATGRAEELKAVLGVAFDPCDCSIGDCIKLTRQCREDRL